MSALRKVKCVGCGTEVTTSLPPELEREPICVSCYTKEHPEDASPSIFIPAKPKQGARR
jgi:hypothetical protein